MTPRLTNLVSFAGAGLVWMLGFHLGVGMGGPLALAVGAYVVLGSLLVAWQHAALGRALAVLWLVAVVAVAVLVSGFDPRAGLFLVTYAALVYGSASFLAWAGSGMLVRTLIQQRSATRSPALAPGRGGWDLH